MQVAQDSLTRYTDLSAYSIFRMAKVTQMYPQSNTADVVFFDGTLGKQLPILGGLTSSVFGLSYTVQPATTLDQNIPPAEIFPQGTPPGGLPACTIDIYCVVSSFSGPRVATGGYFIVGFIQPQFSEMKFAVGEAPDSASLAVSPFDRLLVYRHASDAQITIDKNATISIQHPSGSRITMGTVNAINGSNPILPNNGVDLTQLDVNSWYHFCNNLTPCAGIMIEDCSGNYIQSDGKGNITIRDGDGDQFTLTADNRITITDREGDTITMNQRTITIKTGGETGNLDQHALFINIVADGEASITGGTQASLSSVGDTNVTGGGITNITSGLDTNNTAGVTNNMTAGTTVNITAGQVINITAPIINLNGQLGGSGVLGL